MLHYRGMCVRHAAHVDATAVQRAQRRKTTAGVRRNMSDSMKRLLLQNDEIKSFVSGHKITCWKNDNVDQSMGLLERSGDHQIYHDSSSGGHECVY